MHLCGVKNGVMLFFFCSHFEKTYVLQGRASDGLQIRHIGKRLPDLMVCVLKVRFTPILM